MAPIGTNTGTHRWLPINYSPIDTLKLPMCILIGNGSSSHSSVARQDPESACG